MSRLALVERTKLNLQAVTVLIKGSNRLEVDMLLQIFLGFGGQNLRRAETMSELRAALDRELIDLVIVDVCGRPEDSLELVRDVRRMTSETRFAPVVLTTSSASPSLLTAARDAGVSYVVTKPLSPRVMFERLVWIVKDARQWIEADTYQGPDRRVRWLGPPAGSKGRRKGDLSPELGVASTPNLSQTDIDGLFPIRKVG